MTEPTLYPESGFLRVRIDLSYDGTNYSGWARQPDQRTVQEEIENALSTITQSPIETIVAGRTDAGVHATGQVIHVDVLESTSLDDLAFKLNRMLDEDIRINKVAVATGAFHARFSATRRYYRYKIMDGNDPVPPINRFDITPWYRTLDVDLLNAASALLVGEHDFAAYCKFREGSTTVRNLVRFDWVRNSEGIVVAHVAADSFCYSMVRNLVGAAVCVAEGRFGPDWIQATLLNKERISDSLVFPSRGLTLYQVDY
ncbi:MAG: tRNA pseudouridine(38-40) synthase TruA [Actinomycetales bacterium]|nr:tRNA pseudouridine(38-40) synthase TruA [Actinomycetales bacterium]